MSRQKKTFFLFSRSFFKPQILSETTCQVFSTGYFNVADQGEKPFRLLAGAKGLRKTFGVKVPIYEATTDILGHNIEISRKTLNVVTVGARFNVAKQELTLFIFWLSQRFVKDVCKAYRKCIYALTFMETVICKPVYDIESVHAIQQQTQTFVSLHLFFSSGSLSATI